jgi:hypothetical protein
LSRIIPVGDVDLADDYRAIKLEEIGQAFQLDRTTPEKFLPRLVCSSIGRSLRK